MSEVLNLQRRNFLKVADPAFGDVDLPPSSEQSRRPEAGSSWPSWFKASYPGKRIIGAVWRTSAGVSRLIAP